MKQNVLHRLVLSSLPLVYSVAVHAANFETPGAKASFLAATREAIERRSWKEHMESLDGTLVRFTTNTTAFLRKQTIEKMLSDDVLSLTLAQSAFIRRMDEPALNQLAEDDRKRAFLEWTMTNAPAMESFLFCVKPEDHAAQVMETLAAIHARDPAGRGKYRNLALACAVVYDGYGEGTAVERYEFFRDSYKKGRLITHMPNMPPWDLVWVVDANVPMSELSWAQTHVRMPQTQWSKAYNMVRYRMDKALGGASLYKEYTLAEILKNGGVCADRAYFAAITAKANGIPAMQLAGNGDRGPHAWFGYQTSSAAWNMETGRYENDNYAAGFATDPQTGKALNEFEIELMIDEHENRTRYERACRLTWLYRVLVARGVMEQAGTVIEMAIAENHLRRDAWMDYVDHLKRLNTSADKWQPVIRRMRMAFRKYADVQSQVDDIELQTVFAGKTPTEIAAIRQRQTERLGYKSSARTDLIVDEILQLARDLEKSGDTNAVTSLYRKSLRQYGHDVVPFTALAQGYWGFSARQGSQRSVLRFIVSVFNHYFTTPPGDYFAATARASLLNQLATYLDADNHSTSASQFRRDADKLMALSQQRPTAIMLCRY